MRLLSPLVSTGIHITESAAATYTEEAVALPTSAYNGIGVVIVGVDIESEEPADTPGAAAYETVNTGLLEEAKGAVTYIDDEDMIAKKVTHKIDDEPTMHEIKMGFVDKIVPAEQGYRTLASKVYAFINSSNAAATADSRLRIWFYLVKFDGDEVRELALNEAYGG